MHKSSLSYEVKPLNWDTLYSLIALSETLRMLSALTTFFGDDIYETLKSLISASNITKLRATQNKHKCFAVFPEFKTNIKTSKRGSDQFLAILCGFS